MSSYYLCDTCGVIKSDCKYCGKFLCWFGCDEKKPIYDGQKPSEICEFWRPKEGER